MRVKITSKQIQSCVIVASRLPLCRAFFTLIYRIQLALITLSFARQKEISALILRRKGVLRDCYPGESDFDITCVTDASAGSLEKCTERFAKTCRILKSLLFPLGETKLIQEKDLKLHLRYCWVNYCDFKEGIHFLYRKRGFAADFLPEDTCEICVYQKIQQILIYFIWGKNCFPRKPPQKDRPFFSRSLIKNAYKIRTLLSYLDQKNTGALFDYCSLPYRNINFMLKAHQRNQIIRECHDQIRSRMPLFKADARFTFRVSGDQEFPPESALRELALALGPIINLPGTLHEEISFFNQRLYKFSKVILIKSMAPLDPVQNNRIIEAVSDCQPALAPHSVILNYPHPVLLDRQIWKTLLESEMITKVLYSAKRYDLQQNDYLVSGTPETRIDIRFIFTDLVESLDLVFSITRSHASLYLFELIFGHILAYNLLLEEKILYLSFETLMERLGKITGLKPDQREIIALYQNGDYRDFIGIDPLALWRIFKEIIIEETEKSRRLLKALNA